MIPTGWLHWLINALVASVTIYAAFLAILTIPFVQDHVIYLHGVKLTWFQDTNVPEQWGFLKNQVTPFLLPTPDGEKLHAWHILPLGVYRRHEKELLIEQSGLATDVTTRESFKLLRDDPRALLVIYLHGAAGTLGSGYRPPSYRALSAAAPDRIHVIAIDYRGFGESSGKPSEAGLLTDALALATWAEESAGIPSSRTIIFSQSIGTAVAISLVHHMALHKPPKFYSGMILVAPFADVETLTATYRLAGMLPLLSPVATFPKLLAFLNGFITSKWPSKRKLAEFVQICDSLSSADSKYDISIIHAEDDYDIPWSHSEILFWHAVNGTMEENTSFDELEMLKDQKRKSLNDGGWVVEWQGKNGAIREQILKYALHDRIMSYPVVSLAVLRAFSSAFTQSFPLEQA